MDRSAATDELPLDAIADELKSLLDDCRHPEALLSSLRRRWKACANFLAAGERFEEFGAGDDRLVVEPIAKDPWSNRYAIPEGVAGDAPLLPPIAYHAECLSTIEWRPDGNLPVPRKVLYHLRMLGHALFPKDERFLPIVTIVLTAPRTTDVMNRAIQSCLCQTYGLIEVLVVAASNDGMENRWLGGNVRLLACDSPGLAAARNLGIAEAAGDFVHFLGSDDELLPEAIAKKVDAYAAVGDARLCFSPILANEGPVAGDFEDGNTLGDPILAGLSRFPMPASSWMAPLWFLEQIGPFETEFRHVDDSRYWFRMARSGMKMIAIREPMTRCNPIVVKSVEQIRGALLADIRAIEELAVAPRQFRYLIPLFARVAWLIDLGFDNGMSQAELDEFHEKIMAIERRIGVGIPSGDGPTAILIDQLLFIVRQRRHNEKQGSRPTLLFLEEREGRLLERLSRSSRVNAADLRRWIPDLPPQPFHAMSASERSSLKFALEQLQISVLLGELSIFFRSLVRLAADYPGHPYESAWTGVARLARVLGDETAKQFYRQKFLRYGWQWLGKARQLLRQRDKAS